MGESYLDEWSSKSLVVVVGGGEYGNSCDLPIPSCLSALVREWFARSYVFVTGRPVVGVSGAGTLVDGVGLVDRRWNVVSTVNACLNLGSGAKPVRGCINMDKRGLSGVDMLVDLEDGRLPFPNGFFRVVYAIDVIEHIGWRNVARLVREVARVLARGGRFIVRTPDVGLISDMVIGWKMPPVDLGVERPMKYMLLSYFLYGNQDYPEDTHKCGFTKEALAELLTESGLRTIELRNSGRHPNIFAVAVKP